MPRPTADAPRAATAADGQHDFTRCQSDQAVDIKWNDMGYAADDLKKHRIWFAACILFFYNSELPLKFPAVSKFCMQAGRWQTIHNKPMDADALATPPHDYDDEENTWYYTSTEYLKTLPDETGRVEQQERGLPAVSARINARTKAWQQAAVAAGALRSLEDPPRDDQLQDDDLKVGGKRKRYLLSKLRTCQNMCFTESMLAGQPLALLRVRVALLLNSDYGGKFFVSLFHFIDLFRGRRPFVGGSRVIDGGERHEEIPFIESQQPSEGISTRLQKCR